MRWGAPRPPLRHVRSDRGSETKSGKGEACDFTNCADAIMRERDTFSASHMRAQDVVRARGTGDETDERE